MTFEQTQIEDLLSVLEDYLDDDEIALVKKAHKLAEKAHEGQRRQKKEQ